MTIDWPPKWRRYTAAVQAADFKIGDKEFIALRSRAVTFYTIYKVGFQGRLSSPQELEGDLELRCFLQAQK